MVLHRIRPGCLLLSRSRVLWTKHDVKYVRTTASCRELSSASVQLPSEARVVIAGGGVIGCSVAYHLAKSGWTDVVLLEQGSLGCGTTWHSAGLVGQMRANTLHTNICQYSTQLYATLEQETGLGTGWRQCGSMSLARTTDRMIYLRRTAAAARAAGVQCEMISAKDVAAQVPLLRVDDLKGALWIPGDGTATPSDVMQSLAKGATLQGVQIHQQVAVETVLTDAGRVAGVRTNQGDIRCEYFVNCAGQWAWQLGQLSSPTVRVPLHSCEHFYVVTKPFPGVTKNQPVIRDPDGMHYTREWSGGVMVGGFEMNPRPIFTEGIPPKFEFQLLEEDWDHFMPIMEQAIHRMPAIKDAEIRQFLNGPESFTPDMAPIMGEAPELPGYFVAAGMNSGGIASAGGVGKVMAEWIISGDPPAGTWPVDIRRFGEMHNNRRYLRERMKEILPMHYQQTYPKQEFRTARRVLMSPLHPLLERAGAVFGETMGYERPNWFSRPDSDDFMELNKPTKGTFGKPSWFEAVRREYFVCCENVGIVDMSSLTKFEVQSAGDEVVTYLQRLCCNEVDVPVGTVLHTGMLNHYGGYENDCRIARLANNHYVIMSPPNQMVRSWAWLNRHLPSDGSVRIMDVTRSYAAFNVLGPRTRELMASLTDVVTMSSHNFPSNVCRELCIGFAPRVRVMTISHVGELGWMLYVPLEYALHLYFYIMKRGRAFGIRNVGHYAITHLCLEHGIPSLGPDLHPSVTPFKCHQEQSVKLDKDFIGRSALLKQKQEGVRQKFVMFLLDNHDLENDLWPWGGEPIWEGGRVVGRTTSAGYGYTLKKQICLGFVHDQDAMKEEGRVVTDDFITKNKFEVEIAGKRFSATASLISDHLKL
ncbi:PREDICTED: pyruvate dehydrogenase phosphatase regulatory subunit, mitochondrial-like [Branchiostoma belcheri]|uniref:Pyruvate dehydrogenase phosphatase regulatory subunit, mitochondrial-like n=1 Tax=Branchiostoma belcheri TaxID=7741 RepID=A0A6P4ZDN8_BRABE|nr:PREDICTED: pyruvate dehydrogenase phosphatase regulatory subunit, mitochondrial-like [Branchiostoma belcheri]